MLKNVVFPAPFGPISETTEPRGIVKSTSLVATSPPNSLRTLSATRSRSPVLWPFSLMLHVVERRVGHALVELGLASLARDQPLGPQEHRRHDDDPVDPELVLRHVEGRPERVVDRVADVGETLLVEEREEARAEDDAPDVAHSSENDHRQDEGGDVEREVVRERGLLEAREIRACDAAEERTGRIRPRFRAHQRNPHRRRGSLVFADRDPGAPDSRVAQPETAEDRDRDQHEDSPEEEPLARPERPRAREEVHVAETGRIDRRDAVRSVGEIEAAEAVAVPSHLREDLAEAERHDREIVAAKTQGREADQDTDDQRQHACEDEQDPDRDVDARRARADADGAEVEVAMRELDGSEPRNRVRAHRVERDVAEVEEACVPHDDVEADGHHRVDAHDHHRPERGIVAEQRHRPELVDVQRIQEGDDGNDGRDHEPVEPRPRRRNLRKQVVDEEDDRDEERERPADEEQADHDQRANDDADLPALPVVQRAVPPPPLPGKPGPPVVPGVADLVHEFAGLCHYPPSGVRSPSRPSGRNTRIRIRIANTIDWVQSLPGACQDRPSLNCWISPMMIAPSTAPGRFPIPPRTADVNAISPSVKPWSNWMFVE